MVGIMFHYALRIISRIYMAKKQTVVYDELGIRGGGIYAVMPFSKLDKNKNAVFKIGSATNFRKRIEEYHTYFPVGIYLVAFLKSPPVPRPLRSNPKETPTKSHHFRIEQFIYDDIQKNGGIPISSTTRIQNMNASKEGKTEWIYTNDTTIHEAFLKAKQKFGGDVELYYLDGIDDQGKKTSINQAANKREKNENKLYTGMITYTGGTPR